MTGALYGPNAAKGEVCAKYWELSIGHAPKNTHTNYKAWALSITLRDSRPYLSGLTIKVRIDYTQVAPRT